MPRRGTYKIYQISFTFQSYELLLACRNESLLWWLQSSQLWLKQLYVHMRGMGLLIGRNRSFRSDYGVCAVRPISNQCVQSVQHGASECFAFAAIYRAFQFALNGAYVSTYRRRQTADLTMQESISASLASLT